MAVILAGCAGYAPRPLPGQPDLAPSVTAITVHPEVFGPGVLRRHTFDPADGLDLWETAMVAVANNPDLRAARKRRGVAEAQLYAAGLFPDPQLSAGLDHPTDDSSGLVNGHAFGLDYDLIGLVAHSAGVAQARAARRQVDLELLWQEWQTIERARSLHIALVTLERKMDLLEGMLDLYQRRYGRSHRALQDGNLTVDVTGTDLTALLDTASQLNQLRQDYNTKRADLALLLGVAPDAQLRLQAPAAPPAIAASVVDEALQSLPRRRPDLLALAAGYASQEARVREAVLRQFPSLTVGVNRAGDTGAVHTLGLSIGMVLPLFSGNRGGIAVERATRAKLREEYQARLDQTRIDAARLLGAQRLILQQRRLLAGRLPELESMVGNARKAYRRRDIGALTFLNMQTTLINKELEQLDLAQQLWDTRLALATLLAQTFDATEAGRP